LHDRHYIKFSLGETVDDCERKPVAKEASQVSVQQLSGLRVLLNALKQLCDFSGEVITELLRLCKVEFSRAVEFLFSFRVEGESSHRWSFARKRLKTSAAGTPITAPLSSSSESRSASA